MPWRAADGLRRWSEVIREESAQGERPTRKIVGLRVCSRRAERVERPMPRWGKGLVRWVSRLGKGGEGRIRWREG